MARLLACATILSMFSLPVAAQGPCAPRETILESLAHDYQESPAALGVLGGGSGGVVEVFTARDGKTWTILVTHPDGSSCIVAAGELWRLMPRQLAGADDTI